MTLIVKNQLGEWFVAGQFTTEIAALAAVSDQPLINWQAPEFRILSDLEDVAVGFVVEF